MSEILGQVAIWTLLLIGLGTSIMGSIMLLFEMMDKFLMLKEKIWSDDNAGR